MQQHTATYPRPLNILFLPCNITSVAFSPDSRYLAISGGDGLIVCQINTNFSNFEPFCCERPKKGCFILALQWIDSETLSYVARYPPVKIVDGGWQIIRMKLSGAIKRDDPATTSYTIDENWNYKKASDPYRQRGSCDPIHFEWSKNGYFAKIESKSLEIFELRSDKPTSPVWSSLGW
jgi:WD40 repeat protein